MTTNPTNATVNAGGSTTFVAAAIGNPTPSVQWQVSSNGGSTWSNLSNSGVYSGVTTTTLAITGATASMNGYEYRAVFSNTIAGVVNSATTSAAALTVDFAPKVTSNPSSQTVSAGSKTSFSAAASGDPAPTVQWQISTDGGATWTNLSNGGVYSGVNTDTLVISDVLTSMNGDLYRAVFTNTLAGAGSPSTATTTAAKLTVRTGRHH